MPVITKLVLTLFLCVSIIVNELSISRNVIQLYKKWQVDNIKMLYMGAKCVLP